MDLGFIANIDWSALLLLISSGGFGAIVGGQAAVVKERREARGEVLGQIEDVALFLTEANPRTDDLSVIGYQRAAVMAGFPHALASRTAQAAKAYWEALEQEVQGGYANATTRREQAGAQWLAALSIHRTLAFHPVVGRILWRSRYGAHRRRWVREAAK